MADALDATVEVSLGQLAVAAGVITKAQRDHLGVELLRRATSRRPTSMARLLVQAGLSADQVRGLLVRGAHVPAVRCDACELGIPQAQLARREEVPCPRCGSLVLGFAVYAGDGEPDDQTTTTGPAPGEVDTTERWPGVLPVPPDARPPRERGTTDRFAEVLPLPDAFATPPSAPPLAPPLADDGANDRTIVFTGVIAAPADEGTVNLPPGSADTRDDPPPDVERTVTFGDVFVLPGRSAPRSDREVSDEMMTLVAPQGFMAMAAAESATGEPASVAPASVGPASGGPTSVAPIPFDPGAVTAPMAKDEIQAMLRKGPPVPLPAKGSSSAPPPAPAPSPPEPALAPVAPAATSPRGDARERPAPARRAPRPRRRWPLVLALLALVVLAGGGAYAAFRYGWL